MPLISSLKGLSENRLVSRESSVPSTTLASIISSMKRLMWGVTVPGASTPALTSMTMTKPTISMVISSNKNTIPEKKAVSPGRSLLFRGVLRLLIRFSQPYSPIRARTVC